MAGWWLWEAPDNCPHRIAVSDAVWEHLRTAADESRQAAAEVGGFLLGTVTVHPDGFTTQIEELLPGKNGLGTRDEFTLRAEDFIAVQEHGLAPGQEVREKLDNVLGTLTRESHQAGRTGHGKSLKSPPLPRVATIGPVVVGWYHTHPGHGVFYSEPDQETHRERFSWPFQVGLVIDPEQERAGFFTWATWQRDVQGDWMGQTLSPTRLAQVKGAFHPWKRGAPKPAKRPLPLPVAERVLASSLVGAGGMALAIALTASLRAPAIAEPDHAPLKMETRAGEPAAFFVRLEPQDRYASLDSDTSRPGLLGIELEALPPYRKGNQLPDGQIALEHHTGEVHLVVPFEVVRRHQGKGEAQILLWLGPDARQADRALKIPGIVQTGPEPEDRYRRTDTGWYSVAKGEKLARWNVPDPGLYQEILEDERGRLLAGRRWEVMP